MSDVQLSIEYEGMAERHELYAKYGIAAEAAQLFETELGTLLLCLQGLSEGWHQQPDGAAARAFLDKIERDTLGRLLGKLEGWLKLDDDLEPIFSAGLRARNNLAHGFFERHNFKIQSSNGRSQMISDLEVLHGELFKAWRLASAIGEAFYEAMRQGHIQRGQP